jgi:hypothetical protein
MTVLDHADSRPVELMTEDELIRELRRVASVLSSRIIRYEPRSYRNAVEERKSDVSRELLRRRQDANARRSTS